MKRPGGWAGHERGLPADWPARRRAVLARDGDVCWMCGGSGADRVDHRGHRDDHRLEMLSPVHDAVWPHCHRFKSSEQGHEAQRKVRGQGKMPVEAHPGVLPARPAR